MRICEKMTLVLATQGLALLARDVGLCHKDIDTIKRRGLNENNFLTEVLPAMGKTFVRSIGEGRFSPPDQFRTGDDGYPLFMGSFFRRVFDGEHSLIISDDAIAAARVIYQVCMYAYKMDMPYSQDKIDLVISNFVSTEEELRALNFEDVVGSLLTIEPNRKIPAYLISALGNNLITAVVEKYDPNRNIPKHGPGITANVAPTKKWDSRLAAGLPIEQFGSDFWFGPDDALTRLERHPVWDHSAYFSPTEGDVAKVILVPKDSRGPRLISAEPAERQWLQQGIKGQLVALLEQNSLSGGHVNFVDQTVNGELALVASKTREWATLDLKDASDRVSLGLVNLLFSGTRILPDILAVRSPYTVLPSGDRLKLSKYAPMGSALCFPVLAASVWALSVSAIAALTGDLDFATSSVYVYGDDLIVPTACAQSVISTLEHFGLKVNSNKSFIDSHFAESCGTDAFYGESITPVRLRSLWSFLTGTGYARNKSYVQAVAHANELAARGLHASAEFYYSLVEESTGPLPYGTDTSPYICRCVTADAWESLNYEWLMRKYRGRRKTRFSAFVIHPVETQEDNSPWAHYFRSYFLIGSGNVVQQGEFTLPRKFELVPREFSNNAFSCGIYSQPEWVRELDRLNPGKIN